MSRINKAKVILYIYFHGSCFSVFPLVLNFSLKNILGLFFPTFILHFLCSHTTFLLFSLSSTHTYKTSTQLHFSSNKFFLSSRIPFFPCFFFICLLFVFVSLFTILCLHFLLSLKLQHCFYSFTSPSGSCNFRLLALCFFLPLLFFLPLSASQCYQ